MNINELRIDYEKCYIFFDFKTNTLLIALLKINLGWALIPQINVLTLMMLASDNKENMLLFLSCMYMFNCA